MARQRRVQDEPFVRVVKRDNASFLYSLIIRTIAIIIAIFLGIVFLQSVSGISMGNIIDYMIKGSTLTKTSKMNYWKETMILLGVALALTPAFKMKFWNIGGQGQILMGGLITGTIMNYCTNWPSGVVILVSLILSILAGGIWAAIPSIFKVKLDANETLFTLMMNYVAIQIVASCVDIWKGKASALAPFNSISHVGWLSSIGDNKYGWLILTVIFLTIIMYIYLKHTKHGYEISVVGESLNTAKYAGMSTTKIIIRTVFLSGALCGLIGFFYVAGINHVISTNTSGSYGFTAIVVSWASGFNPFGMFIISLIMIFISLGSSNVVNYASNVLNAYTSYITVGIFLFFLIGCEFFIRYRLVYSSKVQKKFAGWFKFWGKVDDGLNKGSEWLDKNFNKATNFVKEKCVKILPKKVVAATDVQPAIEDKPLEIKDEKVNSEEVK